MKTVAHVDSEAPRPLFRIYEGLVVRFLSKCTCVVVRDFNGVYKPGERLFMHLHGGWKPYG